MKRKYKCLMRCNICGEDIEVSPSFTKIGRFIKIKLAERKHWHTEGEVLCKKATGVYWPTIEKEWEKVNVKRVKKEK